MPSRDYTWEPGMPSQEKNLPKPLAYAVLGLVAVRGVFRRGGHRFRDQGTRGRQGERDSGAGRGARCAGPVISRSRNARAARSSAGYRVRPAVSFAIR